MLGNTAQALIFRRPFLFAFGRILKTVKTIPLTIISLLLLGGCVYAETPDGRIAILDLPVQNETTVNKNVTINAPPGTTVIYQEAQPVSTVYPRQRRYYRY